MSNRLNTGVPASPSGYSAEPEPSCTVSAVPVSIPNAERDEFCARFKARMIARAGDTFEDGESIVEYADMAAPSYWEDEDCRADGPEECADADISYWGEE